MIPEELDRVELCGQVRVAIESSYQLARKKATELLVWLISDVHRTWKPEISHSIPVAYGLKGYSLPARAMRNMCEEILQECFDKGMHVAWTTFDGQWMPLANRDANGKTLTLLQLQKDVWLEVKSKSMAELCQTLSSTKTMKSDIESGANGGLVVTCQFLQWMYSFLTAAHHSSNQNATMVIDDMQDSILDTLPVAAVDALTTEDEDRNHRPVAVSELETIHNKEPFPNKLLCQKQFTVKNQTTQQRTPCWIFREYWFNYNHTNGFLTNGSTHPPSNWISFSGMQSLWRNSP